MSEYNYPNFPLDMAESDFADFPRLLAVEQRAPDGELIDAADARTVRLADHWRDGPLVIEFGSIT